MMLLDTNVSDPTPNRHLPDTAQSNGWHMKKGSILKAVADHRWGVVGWMLIIWRALNLIRPGYPPPRTNIRGPREHRQGQHPPSATHDAAGIAATPFDPTSEERARVRRQLQSPYTNWS